MKLFFKLLLISLSMGAAFMAGMVVSQFSQYAVWVLVYSGAAFMGGIGFGLRWERSWQARQDISEDILEESTSKNGIETHTEAVMSIKQQG